MKITGNEPLRFAVLTDTHVSPARAAAVEQLGRTYAALARLSPDFVLHCGDITDTGLPREYDLYQQAIPAALRGRVRHVPGHHDVRWDLTAKGLYRHTSARRPIRSTRPMSILSGSIPPRRCWSPAIAGAKACTGSTAILAGWTRAPR